MKIVHISQHYFDGLGYDENLLPKYHKKIGCDVVVVTSFIGANLNNKIDYINIEPIEYEDNGVRIIRLPILGHFKERFVIFRGLEDILNIESPDYIYHHGDTQPSIYSCVNYKKKHPSTFLVLDCHEDFMNSARKRFWKLFYYNLLWSKALNRFMNYIDLVFGVTPARCFFAKEELKIPMSKIRLLPLGADEDGARDILNKKNDDNKNNNKIIRLITGGNLNIGKKVINILKAIEGLDVKLILFGNISNDLLNIINLYKKRGALIEIHGWQDRKGTLKLLHNADIAIWYRHTTLIEDAIAVFTPLLLRYYGSTCHLIRGNGYYLYSNNPLEIRQALETIIEKKELLQEMRNNSKEMLSRISYRKIAKESIDYYYDTSPKETHEFLMSSYLCNPNNEDFKFYK